MHAYPCNFFRATLRQFEQNCQHVSSRQCCDILSVMIPLGTIDFITQCSFTFASSELRWRRSKTPPCRAHEIKYVYMFMKRIHLSITSVETKRPTLPRAVSVSRQGHNLGCDKPVWAEYTLAISPLGRFHVRIPAAKWTDANRTQLLVEG